ncbi:hypothetical protein ACEQ8H_001657 [Pleosporales sp. CAS-2024a]
MADINDGDSMLLTEDGAARFTPSRNKRRRRRTSRPAAVIEAIETRIRNMYSNPVPGKVDLSYRKPRRHQADGQRQKDMGPLLQEGTDEPLPEPVSLYTILARFIQHVSVSPRAELDFVLTRPEQQLLHRHGHNLNSIERWATCLLQPNSGAAAQLFQYSGETVPFFLVLMLLRRQHLSRPALDIIMRHVSRRVLSQPLTWDALKIYSVRLIRHARKQWPESMPWFADFFTAQAGAIFGDNPLATVSPRRVSDMTRFFNLLLLLLSFPANTRPVVSARHQEKAQLKVLQYMASQSPAILVTQAGFRAISRNQLARWKTAQERDWAALKGPSWPPWREDRTAMDEDKSYEYGASRASKILHRMHEAGYRSHVWEEMLQVYAGWDTDLSPTIQTRTSLPHVSSPIRDRKYITELLWSARVRSTRTQREAWACFLAYELSGAPVSALVYLAMFEKLLYPRLERSIREKMHPNPDDADEELHESDDDLFPGDMKEVLADATSPLHYVYLSEPVPSVQGLIDRMQDRGLRPCGRLLAFFLETLPNFQSCLFALDMAKDDFDGGIGHLLNGHFGHGGNIDRLPGYLLSAFIQCLCRFGQHALGHYGHRLDISPDRHASELSSNPKYLMRFAYELLVSYRPLYRPVWSAYMAKVIRSSSEPGVRSTTYMRSLRDLREAQYEIVWKLVDTIEEIDLGVDDEIFKHACVVTSYAAQVTEDAQRTRSRRLRALFQNLVGLAGATHSGSGSDIDHERLLPPHIPGPVELHAYVRALGKLHDYEGLYSFAVWLNTYHHEINARCRAHPRSAKKWLFKTLVALRASVTGYFQAGGNGQDGAPAEIVELIKTRIEGVEEWGGWPCQKYVDAYVKGYMESELPSVAGR